MSEKLDAMFGADAADYIRQLQDEIERLRADALSATTLRTLLQDTRAECDELLAALKELTADITGNQILMDNVSLAKFEAVCDAIAKAEGRK
jgi:hypothetical protein